MIPVLMQISRKTHLNCVKYDVEHKACETDNNPSKRQFVVELVSNVQRGTVSTDDEYDAGCEQQSYSPGWQHLTAFTYSH